MRQRSNLIILFGIAFFLVGGVIVFLVLNDEDEGGVGSSSSSGEAQVSVLVAKDDIAPNTLGSDVIADGLLEIKSVDVAGQPVGALTSPSQLENKIFAAGVEKGSAIVQAQLATRSLSNVQVPEGFDGVAVTIDYTNGGAGYVAPGDTVNVYGVFGPDADGGVSGVEGQIVPRSELVLTNVVVLDVSAQQGTSVQQPATAEGQDPTLGRQPLNTPLTYLLALKPADAERIIQVTSFAELYLSLTAEEAPNVGDTPGVTGENVIGPVSADSAARRG